MKNTASWLAGLQAIILTGLLLQSVSNADTADSWPQAGALHPETQHSVQPAAKPAESLLSQLQSIGQLLQQQQWQQLPTAWLQAEYAWQQLYTTLTDSPASRLFAAQSPTDLTAAQRQQQLNKIYNRLQLAYLLFQQQPEPKSFRAALQQALQDLQRLQAV